MSVLGYEADKEHLNCNYVQKADMWVGMSTHILFVITYLTLSQKMSYNGYCWNCSFIPVNGLHNYRNV